MKRCFCFSRFRPYTCRRRDDVQKSIRPGHLSSAINLHQTANTPRHRRLAYILKHDKLNVWSSLHLYFLRLRPSANRLLAPCSILSQVYLSFSIFLPPPPMDLRVYPSDSNLPCRRQQTPTTHPTCIKRP